MSLDAPLTPREGRCYPDVGAGRVNVLADAHEAGIHAPARHDHDRVRKHVGRREADALPPPVPNHYLAPQNVRPPQEAGSLLHLAVTYESPYAGRADTSLPVLIPDGDRVGLPTHTPHKAFEIPGVSRRHVAEPEVLPHHDDAGPDLADEHLPHELLGAFLGELLVEGDLPHLIHPIPEKSLPPELRRREQLRLASRRQHRPRMRVEGRRHHPAPPSPSLFHGPPHDHLVPEVYPVEVPQRNNGIHRRSSRCRRRDVACNVSTSPRTTPPRPSIPRHPPDKSQGASHPARHESSPPSLRGGAPDHSSRPAHRPRQPPPPVGGRPLHSYVLCGYGS